MTDKGLPPFVRSWRQFYWLIVLWLIACIVLMYIFTVYFG